MKVKTVSFGGIGVLPEGAKPSELSKFLLEPKSKKVALMPFKIKGTSEEIKSKLCSMIDELFKVSKILKE